jgi:hypothetical protein
MVLQHIPPILPSEVHPSTPRTQKIKIDLGCRVFRGTVAKVTRDVKTLFMWWYEGELHPFMGDVVIPEEAYTLFDQTLQTHACGCGSRLHEGKWFEPGVPLLRGMVHRWHRVWYAPWRTRPHCAVICPDCEQVVGWEEPKTPEDTTKGPYR